MRHLLVLCAVLAACEIQPPPPKQQTAPAPPPAPAAEAPPAPKPVPAGSGSAALEVTQACVDISSHIVDVFIEAATDPGLKSVYEQERVKMLRATAEACTSQRWSPEALACYNAGKSAAEIKACEQKFTPPPAARPQQPVIQGEQPAELRPLGEQRKPGEPIPVRPSGPR